LDERFGFLGGVGMGLFDSFGRFFVVGLDGLDDGVETAAVAGFIAMEGDTEAVEFDDGPVGEFAVVRIHGIGLVVEGVLVSPGDVAEGLGHPELEMEGAEDGLRVLRGDAFGAGDRPGVELGGEQVDFGVEAVGAGVLRDALFARRCPGAGGLESIGAVGGQAAFGDLKGGHGQAAFPWAMRNLVVLERRRR
jgi:hypothetical protein